VVDVRYNVTARPRVRKPTGNNTKKTVAPKKTYGTVSHSIVTSTSFYYNYNYISSKHFTTAITQSHPHRLRQMLSVTFLIVINTHLYSFSSHEISHSIPLILPLLSLKRWHLERRLDSRVNEVGWFFSITNLDGTLDISYDASHSK